MIRHGCARRFGMIAPSVKVEVVNLAADSPRLLETGEADAVDAAVRTVRR